jgi:hypothetical protein
MSAGQMETEKAQTYRNVMEDLVNDEIEHQLRRLPTKLREYICVAEVTAYALNRLPPLYATCEKGWRQQRMRAKQELAGQVTTVVRQALAAIQRDPLRVSTPLRKPDLNSPVYALEELKRILLRADLTWDNAADVVEQSLMSTARGDITWKRRIRADEPFPDWDDNERYFL